MNTKKLKVKMLENDVARKDIACKTKWNCALCTVSQKINGVRPITLEEANVLADMLKLTPEEFYIIFFEKEIA